MVIRQTLCDWIVCQVSIAVMFILDTYKQILFSLNFFCIDLERCYSKFPESKFSSKLKIKSLGMVWWHNRSKYMRPGLRNVCSSLGPDGGRRELTSSGCPLSLLGHGVHTHRCMQIYTQWIKKWIKNVHKEWTPNVRMYWSDQLRLIGQTKRKYRVMTNKNDDDDHNGWVLSMC